MAHLRRKIPKFQCQECGHQFYSVAAARRASFDIQGCPGCGGSDIDVYLRSASDPADYSLDPRANTQIYRNSLYKE